MVFPLLFIYDTINKFVLDCQCRKATGNNKKLDTQANLESYFILICIHNITFCEYSWNIHLCCLFEIVIFCISFHEILRTMIVR